MVLGDIGDPGEAHIHGRDLDNLAVDRPQRCRIGFLLRAERLLLRLGLDRGRRRRRNMPRQLALQRDADHRQERRDDRRKHHCSKMSDDHRLPETSSVHSRW
jgi:hypothetical protein